ncbi:MAG: hypothetical protein NHB32_27825 [Fischerella sp. CENA71]|nr:hypothetical protein [Fischerella sp. CENA71]
MSGFEVGDSAIFKSNRWDNKHNNSKCKIIKKYSSPYVPILLEERYRFDVEFEDSSQMHNIRQSELRVPQDREEWENNVIQPLVNIKSLVDKSAILLDKKKELVSYLTTAQKYVQTKEPSKLPPTNKQLAANNLDSMAVILEDADSELWKTVKPELKKVIKKLDISQKLFAF